VCCIGAAAGLISVDSNRTTRYRAIENNGIRNFIALIASISLVIITAIYSGKPAIDKDPEVVRFYRQRLNMRGGHQIPFAPW
jgi:hypothetical protein